jgi:hypothetical protein
MSIPSFDRSTTTPQSSPRRWNELRNDKEATGKRQKK